MARLINTRYIDLHGIPGSIRPADESPDGIPKINMISYSEAGYREDILDPESLLSWKPRPEEVTWIDICHFRPLLSRVSERFGLHPLTAEDISNSGHNTKIETLPEYRFAVVKMLRLEGGEIITEQLSLVQRGNLILSFQDVPGDVFEPLRRRIREGAGRIRSRGGDYALFALLDALVDHYILAIEYLGNGIEDFEDGIFDRRDEGVIGEIRRAKNLIAEFRRYSQPLEDAVERQFLHKESGISADDRPFYADLRDHLQQVNAAANGYREQLRDQLNLHAALQNYRLSEIIKVLTIISTIFIPLSFLAGVYGMNFRIMPGLETPWAFPALMGAMGTIAAFMLVFFRRRGWLGSGMRRRRRPGVSATRSGGKQRR
jgi:magnesium transporter